MRGETSARHCVPNVAGRFCLDVRQVQKMLKRVTLGVGRDPNVISTHSLRVAGASAVANRGVQDHFIQSVGRW